MISGQIILQAKNGFQPALLQPGDLLGYTGSGAFDRIIQFRTASWLSHVEIAISQTESVASRNGVGVGRYPLRTDGLLCVLRPRQAVNMTAAMDWFNRLPPTPYGWLELLNCVVPWDVRAKGMFCSQFACLWYRAGGFEMVNPDLDAAKVVPADYPKSDGFLNEPVWSMK